MVILVGFEVVFEGKWLILTHGLYSEVVYIGVFIHSRSLTYIG